MMQVPYTSSQISPAALFEKKATETHTLIDVRSPIEFENEHIPGSTNLPLDQLSSRCEEIRQEKSITLICRSGKRAERAAYELAGKGFSVKVLEGGLLAWQQAGLPVNQGKKRLPIERQVQLTVGLSLLVGVGLGCFVDKWFLIIPAFFGAGLTFAGLSGTCGLAILLMKAPWNKLTVSASCNKKTGSGGCCG